MPRIENYSRTDNYRVTLPTGDVFHLSVTSHPAETDYRLEEAIREKLTELGQQEPYEFQSENPKLVVRVQSLKLQGDQIVPAGPIRDFPVHRVFARPTGEQFSEIQKTLLQGLPPTIASFISSKAYADGHSAGYEEVLSHVLSLRAEMEPVTKALQYYLTKYPQDQPNA